MPFLIVQRYNGSLSALTRSSPADGEKNLHRRIFLFQGGIAIFNSHAVVFISPNLAGQGCRREYRHDKNTAYSGSLDARRNNQQQIGLTIIRTICCLYNLLSWQSVVKTIYRQNNLLIKRYIDSSTYRFVELSNCRENNCYVIKGKSRHLFSLPQSYHSYTEHKSFSATAPNLIGKATSLCA